jgi:CBS domain-containing protein
MPLLARDAMQSDVVSVRPDETLADLESLLLRERIGGVPVVEDGKVVGIVSRSDVVRTLSIQQTLAEVAIGTFDRSAEAAPEEEERAERQQHERMAEAVGRRLAELRVADAMLHAVISVEVGDPIRDVARALVEHGTHRVVVLDGGRLAGIISSLDLVGLIADERVG